VNPEEKQLLQRTLKLAEENSRILRKMERRAKLAALWGFVKLLIIVVPLVIGYLYLEPHIDTAIDNYRSLSETLGL
jgi:hypothetical protein